MSRLAHIPSRHPGGARVVWRIIGSVFGAIVILFGTAQVVTALAHEEETIVTVFDDAEIATLSVESDVGSVRVVGSERRSISVTERVSDGLVATDRSARVQGDQLRLEASCPDQFSDFCEVDYVVEVPTELAVVIHVDDGSVTVRDVDGSLEVSTENGGIELEGLSGKLRADSENGSVIGSELRAERVEARSENGSVRLSWNESPRSVVARSENGSVELVVPDTPVAFRVDLTSDNGSVDTKVRTDPTGERSLTAHSDNGNVTARYGD